MEIEKFNGQKMDDLSYFLWLSEQVNENMICNLSDEKQLSSKKEEKKKNKLPVKEPKPEKEKKVQQVTLMAAQESENESPEQEYSENDNEGEMGEYDDNDEGATDENQYKFSAIQVPVNIDINKKIGKNKYQKLREARKQDEINALDPKAAAMQQIKTLAAGGKVMPTAAQVEKSIKKEKKEKRKRYEKKIEKEAKEKRNENKKEQRNNFKKNNKNNKSNNFKGKGKNPSGRPNFKKAKRS